MKFAGSCRFLAFLLIGGFVVLPSSFGQTKTPRAEGLQLQLEAKREEARKPLISLQDNYDRALEQLGKEEQKKANLNGVLEIKEERKQFRERAKTVKERSAITKLNELRNIYGRESARIRSEIQRKEIDLVKAHIVRLDAAAKELTQAGKIEEAQKVVQNAEAARSEIDALRSGSALPPAGEEGEGEIIILAPKTKNYVLHDKCELDRDGERFKLTTAAAFGPLKSKKDFQTPFRIEARAEALGHLRLYYGESGQVIFNWNVNPEILQVGDPNTTMSQTKPFPGAGKLSEGKTYDIEVRVEESEITVRVDGKVRARLAGDFADAEGPVGIGPSAGSTIWVESFKGIQLEKD